MAQQHKQTGFTIVELLIVIVVIAILAAISVIAYNGLRDRANSSQAKSALNQAERKLELYKVDNDSYPLTGNLAAAGIDDSNVYQYESADGSSYCITATASTVSHYTTSQSGISDGACEGHANGGVMTITNLMENPSAENNISRWAAGGGGANRTLSHETSGGHSGDGFFRATYSATVGSYGPWFSFYAEAGEVYTASAWIRTSKAVTITPNCASTINNPSVSLPANTWTRVWCTGTKQITGYSTATFYDGQANPGDYVDADDGMVTLGSTLHDYADGSASGWSWNGTPELSTSTGPAS